MKQILQQINNIKESIFNGEIDPLKGDRQLKHIENCVKQCRDDVYADVYNEVCKYEKEELKEKGIELRKGKITWGFKSISLWNELIEKRKRIEDLAKSAYKHGAAIYDTESGEEIQPAEPKYSKDVIIYKK